MDKFKIVVVLNSGKELFISFASSLEEVEDIKNSSSAIWLSTFKKFKVITLQGKN